MAERDKGEFELILGNRQMFSVLALVVILLGVFFAMGYLAGRSGSTAVADAVSGRKAETGRPAEPIPQAKPVPSPALNEPQPSEVSEPKPTFPDRKTVEPVATPKTTPPAAPKPAVRVGDPPDGKYLQASALPKPQADAMLALLAKEGIKGQLALSPKKNPEAADLYRVLIGPLGDSSDIAKARSYLKDKGIDKPIPRTYPDAR